MKTRIFRQCFCELLVAIILWSLALLPVSAADNPPLDQNSVLQAPSLMYPLARRYPMSSLFDHSNPSIYCSGRNGIMTIYTGATAQDDPNQDCTGDQDVGDYIEESSTSCIWRVTDCDPEVKDLRWQNFEWPGWLYYDRHTGYDLSCPSGTHVTAAAAGTTAWEGSTTVYVIHSDGSRTYFDNVKLHNIASCKAIGTPEPQLCTSFRAERSAAEWNRGISTAST